MRLSILTPSYNYGHFIDDSAQSIAAQGVPVQWVIQDAESKDSTADVAAQADSGTVVVDYRSEPDAGQSDALNRALSRANGDWIGWLNADEFYLQGAFQEVVQAVFSHPDADVIFGDSVLVDEAGRYLRRHPSHAPSRAVLRWGSCYISSCAVFVRAEVLREMGWDTGFRRIMDWDLWLRLEANGANFQYIPTTLAAFRVHDAQVTHSPAKLEPEEFAYFRRKHGMPAAGLPVWQRVAGRGIHIGMKVVEGAYVRQVRGRLSFRGRDMHWWRDEVAADSDARP
jgi:glycosyltransferase involved in cell wall biosynthesis